MEIWCARFRRSLLICSGGYQATTVFSVDIFQWWISGDFLLGCLCFGSPHTSKDHFFVDQYLFVLQQDSRMDCALRHCIAAKDLQHPRQVYSWAIATLEKDLTAGNATCLQLSQCGTLPHVHDIHVMSMIGIIVIHGPLSSCDIKREDVSYLRISFGQTGEAPLE